MIKFALSMLLACVLATGAIACGGDGEKTVNIPGGGNVSVSEDLPDEFPDSFPIYGDADFVGSIRGSSEGIEGLIATWETGDSIEDVKQFFDDEFEGGDWTVASSGDLGDSSAFWTVESKDRSQAGYISASRADDKTAILVTIGDNPDAASSDGDTSDTDGDSSSDDDGDDASSTGDGASADLPEEADLPDDFPTDRVPIPDGARIANVSSFSSGGADTFSLELYSEDDVDALGDYFKEQLTAKGWTNAFTSESDGVVYQTYSGEEGTTGGVTLTIEESDVEGYARVSMIVSSVAD